MLGSTPSKVIAESHERRLVTNGDGLPCSKCGNPVEPSDRLCSVVLRGLPYGFHTACFDAWSAEGSQMPA